LEKSYEKYCPTDKAECVDLVASCPTWAAMKPSECTANDDWMLPNCQMSCCPICTGKVKTPVKTYTCPKKGQEALCVANKQESCDGWSKKDECTANNKWMIPNCMQSCCETCQFEKDGCPTIKAKCTNTYEDPDADKDSKKEEGSKKCGIWAKAGECSVNPDWMKKHCADECCPVCTAAAPTKAPVVYQQPRVAYQQQPIQQIAQPAFGGYSTGINAVPSFGGYAGMNYGR